MCPELKCGQPGVEAENNGVCFAWIEDQTKVFELLTS